MRRKWSIWRDRKRESSNFLNFTADCFCRVGPSNNFGQIFPHKKPPLISGRPILCLGNLSRIISIDRLHCAEGSSQCAVHWRGRAQPPLFSWWRVQTAVSGARVGRVTGWISGVRNRASMRRWVKTAVTRLLHNASSRHVCLKGDCMTSRSFVT